MLSSIKPDMHNDQMTERKRYLFLRVQNKTGNVQVGCLAMKIDRNKNQISYAFSVCSPKDRKHYTSKRAIEIAFNRLAVKPTVLNVVVPKHGYEITTYIMNDIATKHSEQTKEAKRSVLALQAAEMWLNKSKTLAVNKQTQLAANTSA